jgi:A/G-specific adenine glycosylase
VSEVMLQQTQVERVVPKFELFLQKFPTIKALAQSPLADVLSVWSGLGYNRRAKMLWQAAIDVEAHFDGIVPNTYEALRRLSGVGPYTARAVMVFGFNAAQVVIETNIRAVYLYHFSDLFSDELIDDGQLAPVIEATLDRERPRDFYNGLMDYGSYLKSVMADPARKSASYTKQSRFEGSKRQVRGTVLKLLVKHKRLSSSEVVKLIEGDKSRVMKILADLVREGMVRAAGTNWFLA